MELDNGLWGWRWVGVLAILVVTALVAGCLISVPRPVEERAKPSPSAVPTPLVVQVVGLQWLNPLQRRDYPTEWQILWTLGLAKPNQNDDMVRTDPTTFSTLRPVASIAIGSLGPTTLEHYFYQYLLKFSSVFGQRYVLDPGYFYTVAGDDKTKWRELAGIRVEVALTPRLEAKHAQDEIRNDLITTFGMGLKSMPSVWSKSTPPDVRVNVGGANAGFTSLTAALDYLKAHPDRSAWVLSWDAPSFPPNDEGMNENLSDELGVSRQSLYNWKNQLYSAARRHLP